MPEVQEGEGGVEGEEVKQVIVGAYYMGYECVEIVLRPGGGGSFTTAPQRGKLAEIKIGADQKWGMIITTLLHEATELIYERLRCRLEPSNDMSKDHGQYVFVLSHVQLSDSCGRLAELVCDCSKDLHKAWQKWGKK
jgi:hypothetical protein